MQYIWDWRLLRAAHWSASLESATLLPGWSLGQFLKSSTDCSYTTRVLWFVASQWQSATIFSQSQLLWQGSTVLTNWSSWRAMSPWRAWSAMSVWSMLQMPPRMPHLGIVIRTMVNLSTSTAMVSQGKEMVSMYFILVYESASRACRIVTQCYNKMEFILRQMHAR